MFKHSQIPFVLRNSRQRNFAHVQMPDRRQVRKRRVPEVTVIVEFQVLYARRDSFDHDGTTKTGKFCAKLFKAAFRMTPVCKFPLREPPAFRPGQLVQPQILLASPVSIRVYIAPIIRCLVD